MVDAANPPLNHMANVKVLRPSFFQDQSSAPPLVTFKTSELNEILRRYGCGVANGERRDYALDFLPDRKIFSIHRRSSERPFFKVEKNPGLGSKQGEFSILASNGRVLRRGHVLAQVLSVLDRRMKLV